MSSTTILLLLLCWSTRTLTLEACPTAVRDYNFNVTGVVRTTEEVPVEGASVTLQLDPTDHGKSPVKTVTLSADKLGGFSFSFLVNKRNVKYTLTVQQEGFEPTTVHGSSPPPANHVIRLNRTKGAQPGNN